MPDPVGGGAEEEERGAAGARNLREDAGEQERHTGGGEGQRARVRHLRALTADRLTDVCVCVCVCVWRVLM